MTPEQKIQVEKLMQQIVGHAGAIKAVTHADINPILTNLQMIANIVFDKPIDVEEE